MNIKIEDLNIHYISYGKETKQTIVLLHGWGQNVEMMKPIGDFLSKHYHIVIIDLPGFGKSEEPKTVWTVFDYVTCLTKLFLKLGIEKPILIGHSFGGKLSLLYSSLYEVEKLMVFAPSYRTEIKKLSMKTKLLKALKRVPGIQGLESWAKKRIGSTDYRSASDMMRKILVETVNTDISEQTKNIKIPTVIVWGDSDEAVSLESAYELEKLIPDSGLIVYENATHYAYLEQLGRTQNIIYSFLNITK